MSQSSVRSGPISLADISFRCNFYQSPRLKALYPNGWSMRTYYTGDGGSYYYMACYGLLGPTGSGSTGMGPLSLKALGQSEFGYNYHWTCSPRRITAPASSSAAQTHESYYSYDGSGSGTGNSKSQGGGGTITATISSGSTPGAAYRTGYFYAHPDLTTVRMSHKQTKNSGISTNAKVGIGMIAYSTGYLAGSATTLVDKFDVNTGRTVNSDATMVSGKRWVVTSLCAWLPGAGKSTWLIEEWQVRSK